MRVVWIGQPIERYVRRVGRVQSRHRFGSAWKRVRHTLVSRGSLLKKAAACSVAPSSGSRKPVCSCPSARSWPPWRCSPPRRWPSIGLRQPQRPHDRHARRFAATCAAVGLCPAIHRRHRHCRSSRKSGMAGWTRCATRSRPPITAGIWFWSMPTNCPTGCGEGLFEKLDWSAIGGKDHYMPQAVSDCGLARSSPPPCWPGTKTSCPSRRPGRISGTWRNIPASAVCAKGCAATWNSRCMADGVAPADVYKTLSTSDGVDRAFRKLDQLKPYIEWWSADAEAAHILASGDVLMTSAPSGQIATHGGARAQEFRPAVHRQPVRDESWAIMKGSPSSSDRAAIPVFYRHAGG